jgi:hypothetical protein
VRCKLCGYVGVNDFALRLHACHPSRPPDADA